MTRRTLLRQSLATGVCASFVEAEEKTSPVQTSLHRIAEWDREGPSLHAVIEVNPDAEKIAAELAKQTAKSALHGLPILIKDNIETADAMHTTAGSLALMDSKPKQDADVVTRLREAGMVIIGKTNLSEWANLRSPKSTSGWSARGGLTRHPHRLEYNASGSSSGSAVAVAAGYVAYAIGTETNGSIVSPASICGIVGLKPTVGLVSQRGIIPITHHQDTAGPMTRKVSDAAALLKVMADAAVLKVHPLDFSTSGDVLKGKRLGVLRSLAGANPQVQEHLEKAIKTLRNAGAEVIDVAELPNEKSISRASWMALFAEFRQDLNAYLKSRDGNVKSLTELIAFNKQHSDEELRYFGQEFLEYAETLASDEDIAGATQYRAIAKEIAGPEGIDAALHKDKLDALICPTNDPGNKTRLDGGDIRGRGCSTPAAVAGYPHLTVPMGFVDDMPIGLSFMGTAWSDGLMLSLGHAFEQLMPAFREPQFKKD